MIKDFGITYLAKDTEEKTEVVKMCRMENLYRCDQRKLVMYMQDGVVKAVVSALIQLAGTRKRGHAPASWLERELQLYLESLEL